MARTPPKHLRYGQKAEEQARQFLSKRGLKLVMRNYRSPYGEIDLIMREHNVLVFVEVRYRRDENHGLAAETIDHRKQRRIRATAEHFLLSKKHWADRPCRFDVIGLSGDIEDTIQTENIHWYPDAF
jgi:putative endonuclease